MVIRSRGEENRQEIMLFLSSAKIAHLPEFVMNLKKKRNKLIWLLFKR